MATTLPGFTSFTTHHCVTGSMRHVFAHAGLTVSEEMLLGLGAGAGFFYWHMKGAPPMLLGRGNVHRPGTDGLELDAARRLGIKAERFTTSSARKARRSLDEELTAGRSVMLNVDMGLLPYFDFPDDYHFGGHVIAVGGVSADGYTIADRDPALHVVPAEGLSAARGSKFKPFPPRNMWYRFDLSAARPPSPDDIRDAIRQNCTAMLDGPISNLGVRGIRKAARLVPGWKQKLTGEALQEACINNFIFIDATGGTGGGIFRPMYGRFLQEAAVIASAPALEALGAEAIDLGEAWQAVARIFHAVFEGASPDRLGETSAALSAIADREAALWSSLAAWAG